MLEKMCDFFEARLAGYDKHMMTNIESAKKILSLHRRLFAYESKLSRSGPGLWHRIGTGVLFGAEPFCPNHRHRSVPGYAGRTPK